MLSLEEIKAAHGPKYWSIEVPEWRGAVFARRLSAQDWIQISEERLPENATASDTLDYFAKIVERCLVNEDGTPLITDSDRYLLTDSPLVTAEIGKQILELNQLMKKPEDSEKN